MEVDCESQSLTFALDPSKKIPYERSLTLSLYFLSFAWESKELFPMAETSMSF